MGIGYNTKLVPENQVPQTWNDFLEWGPQAALTSPNGLLLERDALERPRARAS